MLRLSQLENLATLWDTVIGGNPFQSHTLCNKPFGYHQPGKYAIEKMKPLQRVTSPLAHHIMAKIIFKNKLKKGRITLIDCYIFNFSYIIIIL